MQGLGFIKDITMSDENSYLVPQNITQVLAGFEVPDLLTAYGGRAYSIAKEESAQIIISSGSNETFGRCLEEMAGRFRPTVIIESGSHTVIE